MTAEIRKVEKPWGYELIFAHTDRYAGKILHVDPGQALRCAGGGGLNERRDQGGAERRPCRVSRGWIRRHVARPHD